MTTNGNSSGKWEAREVGKGEGNLKEVGGVGENRKMGHKKVLSDSVRAQIGKLQKHAAVLGVSEGLLDCVLVGSVPLAVE